MRYQVTLDGRSRDVDVQVLPSGAISVALDDADVDLDVVTIPGGVSLRLNGKIYDVLVGGDGDNVTVACGPHRVAASVQSERAQAAQKKKGRVGSGKDLRTPMPGRVVKLLVKVGDEVAANQPLIVVEAMKMENDLRAPSAGKVAEIKVKEGDNVEGNALLLTLA